MPDSDYAPTPLRGAGPDAFILDIERSHFAVHIVGKLSGLTERGRTIDPAPEITPRDAVRRNSAISLYAIGARTDRATVERQRRVPPNHSIFPSVGLSVRER
jgi:hypothetical protein